MDKLKINKYYKRTIKYLERLGDIRYSGQLIFLILIVMLTWSGVRSLETNYKLQLQIASLNQSNQLASLENTNISLENQYLESNQFLDISARQNLGLASTGEQELLMPKNVALSYIAPSNIKTVTSQESVAKPSNYQLWVDFFLHRNEFSTKR